MWGSKLDMDVKGVGPRDLSVAMPLLVNNVTSVVIVGLIEFCVQWIELLSATLFCYVLISVDYGSTFHHQ